MFNHHPLRTAGTPQRDGQKDWRDQSLTVTALAARGGIGHSSPQLRILMTARPPRRSINHLDDVLVAWPILGDCCSWMLKSMKREGLKCLCAWLESHTHFYYLFAHALNLFTAVWFVKAKWGTSLQSSDLKIPCSTRAWVQSLVREIYPTCRT